MSNRDDFETAWAERVGMDTAAWYLREHRQSDDMYLFEAAILTAMVNAGWWAWRMGQATVLAGTTEEEKPNVLH